MSVAVDRVMREALLLPDHERAALAEGLLASLDATDPRRDALWASEAEDRLAAYGRGEIDAIPLDEALDDLSEP